MKTWHPLFSHLIVLFHWMICTCNTLGSRWCRRSETEMEFSTSIEWFLDFQREYRNFPRTLCCRRNQSYLSLCKRSKRNWWSRLWKITIKWDLLRSLKQSSEINFHLPLWVLPRAASIHASASFFLFPVVVYAVLIQDVLFSVFFFFSPHLFGFPQVFS